MVDSNTDPEVVTSRILRETRAAEQERAQAAALVGASVPTVAEGPVGALAIETVPVEPTPQPTDPEMSFRRGRLAVVAVIVLVLLLIWIRQRRSS